MSITSDELRRYAARGAALSRFEAATQLREAADALDAANARVAELERDLLALRIQLDGQQIRVRVNAAMLKTWARDLDAANARIAELESLLRRCVDDEEGLYALGLEAGLSQRLPVKERAAYDAREMIVDAVSAALKVKP